MRVGGGRERKREHLGGPRVEKGRCNDRISGGSGDDPLHLGSPWSCQEGEKASELVGESEKGGWGEEKKEKVGEEK